MLDYLIDGIGALCAVMLTWYLVKIYARKAEKNRRDDPASVEAYLQKITLATGFSVYDTFHKSAEDWHVSKDKIERDFSKYLSTQNLPYYVKDFVRRNQKQIDEVYKGKGLAFTDKRLWLFYSLLILVFWGGAVFLSLYVLPNIWPEPLRGTVHPGPP